MVLPAPLAPSSVVIRPGAAVSDAPFGTSTTLSSTTSISVRDSVQLAGHGGARSDAALRLAVTIATMPR